MLDPYFKEVKELNHEFINKHPLSFASAHVLRVFARDLSTDTLQLFYDRFPDLVKQSRYGVAVAKQLAERKIAIPGTRAPLFTKLDINGKSLSLESLKGKYVLLDFWGSWCVPCRKGNPHLISLYEKYRKLGFEIIGIAADDQTQYAWRKAVKDDKLPWLQILQGDLSDQYKIASYPTKILIDQKGNIIGRFGEEQHSLDNMLEKIFKVNK
ncbi:MAG: TlpA family protein disulfide reductase [Bacteroidia bacterium]